MRQMLHDRGPECALLYLTMLQMIYQHGYYLQIDENTMFSLHDYTYIDEDDIPGYLEYLLDKKVFSREMYRRGVFTSKCIQEQYMVIAAKCRRKSKVKEFSLLDDDFDAEYSEDNPQIEESKEKQKETIVEQESRPAEPEKTKPQKLESQKPEPEKVAPVRKAVRKAVGKPVEKPVEKDGDKKPVGDISRLQEITVPDEGIDEEVATACFVKFCENYDGTCRPIAEELADFKRRHPKDWKNNSVNLVYHQARIKRLGEVKRRVGFKPSEFPTVQSFLNAVYGEGYIRRSVSLGACLH